MQIYYIYMIYINIYTHFFLSKHNPFKHIEAEIRFKDKEK